MKKKTSDVVRIMKEEYDRHLKGILNELKPYTSTGIITIGPDLKVIEKRSGLEYTVKSVMGEPGNMKITLRVPEEPRASAVDPSTIHPDFMKKAEAPGESFFGVESAKESDEVQVDSSGKDYGVSAYPEEAELDNPHDPELNNGETEFVVDEKEFTKYYKEA